MGSSMAGSNSTDAKSTIELYSVTSAYEIIIVPFKNSVSWLGLTVHAAIPKDYS